MNRLPRTLPPQPGLARRETAAPDRDPPDVLERPLIVDGHEDLSMGALAEGRDYLTSARSIRALEAEGGLRKPERPCMLGLADWLAARVAVIVATVQTIPRSLANPGEMSDATIEGAHQQALAHLISMAVGQRSAPISSWSTRSGSLRRFWRRGLATRPTRDRRIGLVLLMENAEPVREPAEIAFWAEHGIRLVGPLWHANRYGGDTKGGGSLTPLGRQLLGEMGRLRLALDLTHMSEEACLEALDSYEGAVVASHAHSRRTADTPRLLSDRVIEGIVARNGIVGVLPLNWALDSNWRSPTVRKRSRSIPSSTPSTTCARLRGTPTASALAATSTVAKGPAATGCASWARTSK